LKIILLGDIAFTGIISTETEENKRRFKEVVPILNSADIVFANLEVPVKVDESKNEFKNFIHSSLPGPTKDLLQLCNIGCVSLANNHIYDCKMSGLRATIDILNDLKIYHTGAGWKREHLEPAIVSCDGIIIAFLAYVDKSTNPKTEFFSNVQVNYFEIEKVKQDISDLNDVVDKVIVSIHWGNDYSYYPIPRQVEMAHQIIGAGANIIMGHHSHTLQPYKKYKDGYIFYSLGGLIFGDYKKEGKKSLQSLFRKTKRSVIVNYDTQKGEVTFNPTKELKGNYVQVDKRDYDRWSVRKWQLYKIKHSSKFLIWFFNFYEKVLYRVYEYFFGFYQNPIKRLLQFRNLAKVRRLFAESRSE